MGDGACHVEPGHFANSYNVWLHLYGVPDTEWLEEFQAVAADAGVDIRYDPRAGIPAVAYTDAEEHAIEELVQRADAIIDATNQQRVLRAESARLEKEEMERRAADAQRVAARIEAMG